MGGRYQVRELQDEQKVPGGDLYAIWDLAMNDWARHATTGGVLTRETLESAARLCDSLDEKPMNAEEMRRLDVGDVIEGRSTGRIYVVTGNYGTRVTAAETVDVTNPNEWKLLRKARR